MNIKAINLDFYGTLLDWLKIWVEVSDRIIIENNLKISSTELALQWREYQRKLLDNKEFIPYKENIFLALEKLCKVYKIKNKKYDELLFKKWKDIEPYQEVEKSLKRLKAGYKLSICTNSSKELFNIASEKIHIKFDYVFISDETKVNKPHPKIYQMVIDSLGYDSKKILHVASSQMDVSGAVNSGGCPPIIFKFNT